MTVEFPYNTINYDVILHGIYQIMKSQKTFHNRERACFSISLTEDNVLTKCSRDKMAAIFRATYSSVLSRMKMYAFLLRLKFAPKGQINNFPVLVQIMSGRRLGDKLLSEPMMVSLLTHICVTWHQWLNDIWLCTQVHVETRHAQFHSSFRICYLYPFFVYLAITYVSIQ